MNMTSTEQDAPVTRHELKTQIAAVAAFIHGCMNAEGVAKADYVALARLDPNAKELSVQQTSALTRALLYAKIESDLGQKRWRQWALIAHGMAITMNVSADGSKSALGAQLHEAGVSRARLTRLFNAPGTTFVQLVPRVLRFMSSRGVAANFFEFSRVIFFRDTREPIGRLIAERTRRNIIRAYAKAERNSDQKR